MYTSPVTTDQPQRNDTMRLPRKEDRDIPSFEAERIPRWTALLVPLLAAGVALPGLGNHLLSDDFALVYTNVGQSMSDLFSPFLHQSTSRAAGGTYRPLTEAFIGLDYLVWGTTPFGYHLVNLIWHVLNSLLCYGLVRVLVPPRPVVALTAGLLFAVHPVHGDAIFWLSGRSDLLCTFFYLASLILFVRGRGSGKRRAPTVLSVVSFILALLSKEVALSLPLLVILIDLAAPSTDGFRQRFRRHIVPRYLPFLLVALAYLGLRLTVLPTIGQAEFPSLKDALYHFFLYIKLLVIPMESRAGLRSVIVVFMALAVAVVMFLRYARMGDRRNLLLGAAWLVTILLPIVDVPRRWQLYLPSVGFCIFFAIVLAGLVWRRDEDHPKLVSRGFGAFLLVLLLAGGVVMAFHASVYGQAGRLANKIINDIKRLNPSPNPNATITAANLPSMLTSWTGNQPVFAFGFDRALKLAYDRNDVHGRLISTLYVEAHQAANPTLGRRPGKKPVLDMDAGGGAYSFSFHTPDFTTGRQKARKDQVVQYPGWHTVIEEVRPDTPPYPDIIPSISVHPKRPFGPIFAWDGKKVIRFK